MTTIEELEKAIDEDYVSGWTEIHHWFPYIKESIGLLEEHLENSGRKELDDGTQKLLTSIGREQVIIYEDRLHPSHLTRGSDAGSFDEICIKCGRTDITCGGWGKLKYPCPEKGKKDE